MSLCLEFELIRPLEPKALTRLGRGCNAEAQIFDDGSDFDDLLGARRRLFPRANIKAVL